MTLAIVGVVLVLLVVAGAVVLSRRSPTIDHSTRPASGHSVADTPSHEMRTKGPWSAGGQSG